MQHNFDVDIAEKYGLKEAILLNHLWFWVEKNKANEVHYYDGTYWTYNSIKAFNKLFPYLSERQINNTLKSLKERGIIQTGNYNKSTYDRTMWYAFTKMGVSIMQKCKMEDAKMSNGYVENVKPIPDINTDIKPDIKPCKSNNTPYNPSTDESQKYDNKIFEKFWNEYPKKISKGNAEKWFKKNKPTNDLVDLMIEKLKIYKETEQWKKDNGKYIPYPSSWLNAKGWEDEIQSNNIKRKYDTSIVYHDKYIGDYKLDENGRRIFV